MGYLDNPKILFAIVSIAMLAGCASKPTQTIENLKAAATNELNANATYTAFAQKAQEEGLKNVSALFQAAAAAESIHAARQMAVLKSLGVTDFNPQPAAGTVGTTLENLATALNGEQNESTTIYPGFIEIATKEKADSAQVAFKFAMEAEKMHATYYQAALDSLTASMKAAQDAADAAAAKVAAKKDAKKDAKEVAPAAITPSDAGVPATWYVCPVCGGLYTAAVEACAICGVPGAQFMQFPKAE